MRPVSGPLFTVRVVPLADKILHPATARRVVREENARFVLTGILGVKILYAKNVPKNAEPAPQEARA